MITTSGSNLAIHSPEVAAALREDFAPLQESAQSTGTPFFM